MVKKFPFEEGVIQFKQYTIKGNMLTFQAINIILVYFFLYVYCI